MQTAYWRQSCLRYSGRFIAVAVRLDRAIHISTIITTLNGSALMIAVLMLMSNPPAISSASITMPRMQFQTY
jgi:Flp pilus assembly protein protease CpaA